MAIFKIWGPVAALLLVASARADHATIERCKPYHTTDRVRRYPTDSKATHLWLDGCNYSNVNSNDLTGLTSVVYIYLRWNDIVSIHPGIFRSVPGLKQVMLDANKLRELPVFTDHSCPDLTDIYLRKNLITGINSAGTFSACTNLRHIYLNGNHIESIHPDAFSSLNQLRELYLNDNKIKFISNQMFVNNYKLIALALSQNRITHLPLDFVSNLKRAGVHLWYFYFSSNPLQCACLLEALADAKRAGVAYYKEEYDTRIIHYDGTRAECVYIGAIQCTQPGLLRPPPRPAAPPAPPHA